MDDPDCRVDIARKVYMGKDGRGSENAVPDCKIEMFVVAEVFQCVLLRYAAASGLAKHADGRLPLQAVRKLCPAVT